MVEASVASLRFEVLGPLRALSAGAPLALGPLQRRVVLAVLLLHADRPVGREALINAVWGPTAPASCVNLLQRHVSALRRVLGSASPGAERRDLIPWTDAGYRLAVDVGHCDLQVFEAEARAARSARSAGDLERAAGAVEAALALYRGPLCAGLASPYLDAQRERLHEAHVDLLEERLDIAVARGGDPGVIGQLRNLIAEHPLRERLRALLMLAMYRSGRQAEALEAFQDARRYLVAELGVEPAPLLGQLHHQILTADPSIADGGGTWLNRFTGATASAGPTTAPAVGPVVGPAVGPVDEHPAHDPQPAAGTPTSRAVAPGEPERLRSGRPPIWSVPLRNTRFVGRTGMFQRISESLRDDGDTLRVLTLFGLGGVGKSHVAIEYAHRFASHYDLVWWIDAQQPVLIAAQFADLASRLELPPESCAGRTVRAVLDELRHRRRWLLMFDNAGCPQDILGYLSDGPGHVLVTSRYRGWGELGDRLEVDVLPRSETVALLTQRTPELDDDLAAELSAELGDLPLAAAQAAAFLEQTGASPGDYLRRFRDRRADLLAKGDVLGYQGRLDTAWTLSLERLGADCPAAVQLVRLAALLAPEPIPLSLLTAKPELLDSPLREAARDADALEDVVGAAQSFSLVRRHPRGFQVHRLVQAAVRQQLADDQRQAIVRQVLAVLAAAVPGDPNDPALWARYAELAPHALATSPLGDEHPGDRRLMLRILDYLNVRADGRTSLLLAQDLLQRWRGHLGADHPDVLTLAAGLVFARAGSAEYGQARLLGSDTLERCRRVFGPDHPTTLSLASTQAFTLAWLAEYAPARLLALENLDRCRKILGVGHPATLRMAGILAVAHAWADEHDQACELADDTLRRCSQTLGSDHPTTLRLAASLTFALAWLGEHQVALALGERTLEHCRRSLGPDHPTTLAVATNVAFALAGLGEYAQARSLGEATLERCRRLFTDEHPATLRMAAVLTYVLAWLGDREAARSLGVVTVDRCRRVLGESHPITLSLTVALTLVLACSGEIEPSRSLGQGVLDRCEQTLGPDHVITVDAVANLTLVLAWAGGSDDGRRARRLAEDNLERCRTTLGPRNRHTVRSAAVLLLVLAWQGHDGEVSRRGSDIVTGCRDVLGESHPITLVTAADLALSLAAEGEADRAAGLGRDTLRRCREIFDDEHPVTLLVTVQLSLTDLSEEEVGCSGQRVLERCRRLLGPNHPLTRRVESGPKRRLLTR
ncbi:MAG TPA: FxSxx-COOH system tetratricopeptide repeat protein [Kineosporiaceae bacterium]